MTENPRNGEPGARRAAIDAGLTGDKVPGADPAAAPLGTDAEAAAAPTPAGAAAADIREQERLSGGAAPRRAFSSGTDPAARPGVRSAVPIAAVVIVAAAVALAILLML